MMDGLELIRFYNRSIRTTFWFLVLVLFEGLDVEEEEEEEETVLVLVLDLDRGLRLPEVSLSISGLKMGVSGGVVRAFTSRPMICHGCQVVDLSIPNEDPRG